MVFTSVGWWRKNGIEHCDGQFCVNLTRVWWPFVCSKTNLDVAVKIFF